MDDNDSKNDTRNIKTDDTQKINEILSDLEAAENESAENELVEDDDAADYETPATGIRISYVLTADEAYKCLYHSDMYKTKGGRAVFQSVILIVAAVAFFISALFGDGNYKGYNIFFSVICLALIAVIWLVPHLHMKSMAKMIADGQKTEAEIYPTHINIGRDDGAWTIPLDGSCQIIEAENIIMIFTPKGQFPIPERAIEPEYLSEIKAILAAGTYPKDEE
ncbi:MAG: hypothetical protein ACI4M3_06465 [Acutalibacteraceae bacterium]